MIRLGFIIAMIALIGALFSGVAGYRAYDQETTVDRIALSRAIDVHASLVQERMTERELLARVASGLFRSPSQVIANMLQPLRASIYAFKTDFVVASWIARLRPDELPAARAELASAGFADPSIRSADDKPRDLAAINGPIDLLMDVEPRNSATAMMPGRSFDDHTIVGPMLARAMAEGRPIVSDPTPLLRRDGSLGIVLAAPVQQDGRSETAGFVAFSYEIGPLMLANDDLSLFSVTVADPREADRELLTDDGGRIVSLPIPSEPSGGAPTHRVVNFGGHDWSLTYYPKTNAEMRALRLGIGIGAVGLALTAVICGLFGYISYANIRLRREIEVRIGFEKRLTMMIDELNHRVKNILAVIQSIVTRTLRHGSDIDTSRDLLIGRIHAMSTVVSLLSESQWQGVPIKGLFEARAVPNADRISLDGPEIVISARAAQSLALLFFELASHSDEGLSLVGKHPNIVAHWEMIEDGADARFHFKWEEFNTSAATRRADSEFGIVLLDRVVPEALGGIARRGFTDVSFVYELSAPLATVIDMNERDRTERFLPGRA